MGGWAARSALAALVLAALVGCAVVPRATVDPKGLLEVLGPTPGWTPDALPGDWIVDGYRRDDGELSVKPSQGVPSLRVVNGKAGFLVVRRTKAFLLASPYLSWAWNVEPQTEGLHPVRLIVGFHGGDPKSPSWGSQPFVWTGSALPPHDRTLIIAWGESALQRGTLIRPAIGEKSSPRYIARGGRENARSWWLETIDLAKLYAETWPADEVGKVSIVFIGIAAAGGRPPAAAHVSGVVLSR